MLMSDTGEVEDDMDFGDCPDPRYPTLLLHDGARHIVNPAVHLGAQIDTEWSGCPDEEALGDDNDGIDDEDGVTFRSHLDGSVHRITPEKAVHIQENLGADIIMAFDECPEPYDRDINTMALARTHLWAERCLAAKTRADQALFAIVQGGVHPDLREQ